MLSNFMVIKIPNRPDLVAINAEDETRRTVICTISVDLAADIEAKATLSQDEAKTVVSRHIDKLAAIMQGKYERDRAAFDLTDAQVLKCALTLDELMASGLTFSGGALDSKTIWGRDGKLK
jgi:hypothetical protein